MKPVMNVTSATVKAVAHGGPQPGQLIADRYKLDRPLERGAMGSVWRAEQVRLRAPVAVKFLDPSLIDDKEMHDRFIQEARSAAAVRSAHVVQVFDYGTEDGVPYIAMELLDGENLDTRLGARGTLSPAELAKLFAEVARGIGQAHAIGVIHRDLKPGNIFIAREGEHEVVKIVDFGIAKVKASALRLTQGIGTQLGTLLGTPQYMSPEQVRGSGSIDHRTDLWALAVIACECLTGRCPFSGATIGDLTVQICTERPPAPSSLGPVPAGFDQWFFKATQKKPNKRFQTAEEMAERLSAVLAPAILAAPGAARNGRRIVFPSRSEVRLAYTAVVTWKGYVMNRLNEVWLELSNSARALYVQFRQLMQRVGRYLAIEWEVVRQRLRELLESERLQFLRPLVERHGLLASIGLFCGGILLLGLTARSADSAPVGARAAVPSAGVPPSGVARGSSSPPLGATAAQGRHDDRLLNELNDQLRDELRDPPAHGAATAADPSSLNADAVVRSLTPLPVSNTLAQVPPGQGEAADRGFTTENVEIGTIETGSLAVDGAPTSGQGAPASGVRAPASGHAVPATGSPALQRVMVPGTAGSEPIPAQPVEESGGSAPPLRTRAAVAENAAEPRPASPPKPAAANAADAPSNKALSNKDVAAPNKKPVARAPIAKPTPAAAKVLSADELLAAMAAKKQAAGAAPAPAPRPARAAKPVPVQNKSNPFDDRL